MTRPVKVVIDRYGKPSKELMVDYINAWNRSHLQPEQLRFTELEALDTTGKTRVMVEFAEHTGWSRDSTPLTYYRFHASSITAGLPLTVHCKELDEDSIYSAIYDQYGVLFERDVTTLIQREGGAGPLDYTVVIHDDHLIFYGSIDVNVRQSIELLGTTIDSLMDLRTFYAYGTLKKPPVEMYATRGEFLWTDVPYDVQRRYELDLRMVDEHTVFDKNTPLVKIMSILTGDPWVCTPDEVPFNLYSAEFVYNGRVSNQWPISDSKYNYTLVLELSNFCANLSGMIRIAYRYAENRPLTNRINSASVTPIFQR